MKRLNLIFGFALIGFSIFAQPSIVLNYETHGIKSETNNEMKICNYMNPGESGENQVWDFSGLQEIKDFKGSVTSAYHSANSSLFPDANTDLEEFNSHFFLKVDENGIEQYGYSSSNNSVIMNFEKPFVKIVFPLSYGINKTGDFNGTISVNNVSGSINGTYEVFADAYGKLILPGGYEVENTIRVKSVKDYDQNIKGSKNHFSITTFRWYVSWHRYPLLVLTEVNSGSTTKTYQAAYNNRVNIPLGLNAPEQTENIFTIYPNPASRNFNLSYTLDKESNVHIEIVDLAGKIVKTLVDDVIIAGEYHKMIGADEIGLTKGTYIIKVIIGNKLQTREFVITD